MAVGLRWCLVADLDRQSACLPSEPELEISSKSGSLDARKAASTSFAPSRHPTTGTRHPCLERATGATACRFAAQCYFGICWPRLGSCRATDIEKRSRLLANPRFCATLFSYHADPQATKRLHRRIALVSGRQPGHATVGAFENASALRPRVERDRRCGWSED